MFYPMMSGGVLSGGYASAEAVAAQNTAREARTNVELLTHDVDRLLLITQALWTLMKREHGYADDVLTKLIEEIDSSEAIVGGMTVKDPPQACPNCGRLNSTQRLFCIYCGKPVPGNPFAR
jgi:hypothetical protein